MSSNATTHILNGDSLYHQMPERIAGQQIITREALVDGSVSADSLDEFFQVRARFIAENYPEATSEEYFEKVVPEFERMMNIPDSSEINLWFEDDLFCQVNFWFVVWLLTSQGRTEKLYLVRPEKLTPYGFAAYKPEQLPSLLEQRIHIHDAKKLAELWEAYQHNELDILQQLAKELATDYPFIQDAIDAHIQRIPTKHSEGRPKETLKTIMEELDTDAFGPVFQEFCKREAIYGFGDLQVKKLFDELRMQD